MVPIYARTLQRAARLLGGAEELRRHLRVSTRLLEAWISGAVQPPADVFLRAVDLLSGATTTLRDVPAVALKEALEAAGTSMGNVQLADTDGLRIVAQHGFERPFLDYFAVVPHSGDGIAATCGIAAREARQIVVPDVESDPIFAGTHAARVIREAGPRAVQSTPIVGRSGNLLGVLSTHYERAGRPDAAQLDAIAAIAQRAARLLEGVPAQR